MENGVFALLDCLGFKGIWMSKDAKAVIEKLLRLESEVGTYCDSAASEFEVLKHGQIIAKVSLLSDTIALSVTYTEEAKTLPLLTGDLLMSTATNILSKIVDGFIWDEPHLMLRGCITFGKHLAEKNFIIGPAVDEAAAFEKIPDGAFIWYTPAAAALIHTAQQKMSDTFNQMTVEEIEMEEPSNAQFLKHARNTIREIGWPPYVLYNYPMPLKGGEILRSAVLNPLACIDNAEGRRKRIDIYRKEMNKPGLDILLKAQKTLDFLSFADQESSLYLAKLRSSIMQQAISEGE